MLNLWSQVGRVGCSCRCPSCLTTKHKLVRRVSTAIATIRHRPKTSSTFLYSAIFAAATVTDAHFKRQRRAHWDDAISKAHAQLEASQRATNNDPEQLLDKTDPLSKEEESIDKSDGLSLGEESNAEKRKVAAHSDAPNSHAHLMDIENVMRYAPRPGAPRPPLPRTTAPLHYPSPWGAEYSDPTSLWSGENQRRKAYARMWTKKKISKAEIASARLAVVMIMSIELESISMINLGLLPEAVRGIARLSRAEQVQLLADLKFDHEAANILEPWERRRAATAGMTVPQYEQREDYSHYAIVDELNESILGLFRAYQGQEIGFVALVVKIVHNLLVSSAPPDLQTVNLLLLGFHGSGDRDHIRYQITRGVQNFCRSVKVRPNEVTCATILAISIEKNDSKEFANFIGLMRAADGTRGLILAKPGISITEASQGRLVPHDQIPDKVYQAVNPSALVFWQVIRGVLKFSGLQTAIEICKNFGKLAWGLDTTCLFELLRQCAKEGDWESGRWVWDQVEIFRQEHHEGLASIIGMMLALCLKCEERSMFDQIFRDALHQKYNLKVGPVTPVVLTDLAEEALRRIEHDHQTDRDEDDADTTEGEMNETEEGAEKPTPSDDREMAPAGNISETQVKSILAHDLEDFFPVERKNSGLDFPESSMWEDDENPMEKNSEQTKQPRIDGTKDRTDGLK